MAHAFTERKSEREKTDPVFIDSRLNSNRLKQQRLKRLKLILANTYVCLCFACLFDFSTLLLVSLTMTIHAFYIYFYWLLLCLQATLESADSICDAKIRQWLHNRKKHADPKRKRSRKNQGGKLLTVATLDDNTPKRHTRSTRHSKRVDLEEEKKVFSPVASSMVLTPVVQRVKHNSKVKRVKKKYKKKNPMMVRKLFVCCLLCLFACRSPTCFFA